MEIAGRVPAFAGLYVDGDVYQYELVAELLTVASFSGGIKLDSAWRSRAFSAVT